MTHKIQKYSRKKWGIKQIYKTFTLGYIFEVKVLGVGVVHLLLTTGAPLLFRGSLEGGAGGSSCPLTRNRSQNYSTKGPCVYRSVVSGSLWNKQPKKNFFTSVTSNFPKEALRSQVEVRNLISLPVWIHMWQDESVLMTEQIREALHLRACDRWEFSLENTCVFTFSTITVFKPLTTNSQTLNRRVSELSSRLPSQRGSLKRVEGCVMRSTTWRSPSTVPTAQSGFLKPPPFFFFGPACRCA